MDKRLKLTDKQEEAWNNLQEAFNKCFQEGVDILVYDFSDFVAVNGLEVNDYSCIEDCKEDKPDTIANVDDFPCFGLDGFSPSASEFGVNFKKGHK